MERDFPIQVSATGQRRSDQEGRHRDLRARGRAHPGKPAPGRHLQAGAQERAQRHEDPHLPASAEGPRRSLRPCSGTESTPQVEYGMWTNGVDFFFLQKETGNTVSAPSSSPGRTGRSRTIHPSRVPPRPWRGCAAARPRCSRRPSAAATTTFTATRACRRTRRSGSSSTCCSPRCMTSGRACGPGARRQFYVQPAEPFTDAGRRGDPPADRGSVR